MEYDVLKLMRAANDSSVLAIRNKLPTPVEALADPYS